MAEDQPVPTHLPLEDLREDYLGTKLDERSVSPDPILQFNARFLGASHTGIKEPNAMTLATATAAGEPSARVVLLKDVSEDGFIFYTNYKSRNLRCNLIADPGSQLLSVPQRTFIPRWKRERSFQRRFKYSFVS